MDSRNNNIDPELKRSKLITELYNSYHEGEAELPDTDATKPYVFDEGTGTLYCKETKKQYETSLIDNAVDYFIDVAAAIESELASSKDPYKQRKKAEYCRIAAESLVYMKTHLEKEKK